VAGAADLARAEATTSSATYAQVLVDGTTDTPTQQASDLQAWKTSLRANGLVVDSPTDSLAIAVDACGLGSSQGSDTVVYLALTGTATEATQNSSATTPVVAVMRFEGGRWLGVYEAQPLAAPPVDPSNPSKVWHPCTA
jgi:hypothetical protein